MSALARYDELMTEAAVCRRFPHLLSEYELRAARQAGAIKYYSGKRSIVLYHPDDVAAYLATKEVECPSDCGNMEDTGFPPRTAQTRSMPTGMTSDVEQHVVDHFARKYLPKPKTASSPSSGQPAQTEAGLPNG